MSFFELVKSRYSLRSFKPQAVESEKIAQILEAARLAPTAKNIQPQRIRVLSSAEDLAKMDECTPCRFGAPTVMLVCYDKDVCWARQKWDDARSGEVDAAIITTHLMYAAEELGLGSCWVMHFDPDKTREVFELPENLVPVAFLPMGYAADDAKPSDFHAQRKNIEEIMF